MGKQRNISDDAELIRKHLLNEMSAEEQEKLDSRIKECPALCNIINELQQHGTVKEEIEKLRKYSAESAYEEFLRYINEKRNKPRFSFSKYIKYAAAVIIILIAGTAIYTSDVLYKPTQEVAIIQPGTSQAKLTLSDGRIVNIKETAINVKTDGITVHYKKGVLSYIPQDTLSPSQIEAEDLHDTPNELATPNGGENTVILADGTTVCLNAGSKLLFPIRFLGKQRIVYLEGEGYFNVAPDATRPFIVQTRLGETEVLGTTFNVSAYPESTTCLTTLVHGKVRCKSQDGSELILHPGEQAITTEKGLTGRTVDIEEYTGWTKGLYTFKNRPLGDIMNTFSRWYNIEITFDSPAIRDITFSGNVKRYESLNTFLNALELTGKINFRIENGKVRIGLPVEETE